MKLIYVSKANNSNQTYKYILKEKLNISERILRRLKNKNMIRFYPSITSINQPAMPNSIIEIDFTDQKSNISPVKKDIDILYEDKFFLFVNKSSGVSSHPSKGHLTDTVSNYVEYYLNQKALTTHIVNRLDKDTSGLLLFAKNSYYHSIISKKFELGEIEKVYIAVVHGIVTKKSGFIEKPIKTLKDSIKREIHTTGLFSLTEFELIGYKDNFSILRLKPHTGRTHQLRLHLSSIGHPIVGDKLYGIDDNSEVLFLHSYSLRFIFPLGDIEYKIIAPIPSYFYPYLSGDF